MTARQALVRRGAELLGALVVAAVVGALTSTALSRIGFPEPSWLPETFGATLGAALVVLTGWLLLRRGTGPRTLWALGTAGPAFLASSHLTLLLHGTPHYLFGLGGDQLNRVAYVTRFADSPALADPFYADAAPFYPPQWFWVGGRLAALLGEEGWLFYKPYAIVTMAVAGALAFVAWRWLVPTRLAVLMGLVTSVVGLHTNAYEPYSWILICLLPQVVVATFLLCARVAAGVRGVAGADRAAGDSSAPGENSAPAPTWPLVVTIGAYLGWAALSYTLIAGVAALLVGLVVVLHAWRERGDRAVAAALLARLAAMAGISAALALLFWHRFLLAALGGAGTEPSVANDFAPEIGARWPLPMWEVSALGALCLIGVVWVVLTAWPRPTGAAVRGAHARPDPGDDDEARTRCPDASLPSRERSLVLAQAVALIVLTVFGWFVLSGLRSLTGSTLLPFRLIPVITLACALAGVVGALALARWFLSAAADHGAADGTGTSQTPRAAHRAPGGDARRRVAAAAVVLAGLAGIQMVQHVTDEDTHFAAVARQSPGPPTEVLAAIGEMTGGREPSELVVLSSEPSLPAYRPYFVFQAPAQAYATPAGQYTGRLDRIRAWAGSDSPGELAAAMGSGPFRGPDVLVLTREGSRRWVLPVMVNEMPLTANNSREEITFRARLFDDPALFDVREVGSRMVIVRR